MNCLLAYPDIVAHVRLGFNRLTDEIGVKLAWYLFTSSTIQTLDLSNNQLDSKTYLVLAAALCVNSSLRGLGLHNNQAVDQTRIDVAFIKAMRVNPGCYSSHSIWYLYTHGQNDFERLKCVADALGPLSMLEQLRHCVRTRTKTKIREICFF